MGDGVDWDWGWLEEVCSGEGRRCDAWRGGSEAMAGVGDVVGWVVY